MLFLTASVESPWASTAAIPRAHARARTRRDRVRLEEIAVSAVNVFRAQTSVSAWRLFHFQWQRSAECRTALWASYFRLGPAPRRRAPRVIVVLRSPRDSSSRGLETASEICASASARAPPDARPVQLLVIDRPRPGTRSPRSVVSPRVARAARVLTFTALQLLARQDRHGQIDSYSSLGFGNALSASRGARRRRFESEHAPPLRSRYPSPR